MGRNDEMLGCRCVVPQASCRHQTRLRRCWRSRAVPHSLQLSACAGQRQAAHRILRICWKLLMWRVEATTARETRPVCHGGWRGWFERQQPAGRHCATASTELFFPQGSQPHVGMRSCRAPLQSSTRWPPSTLIVPYYFSAASRVASNCGYSRRKSRQTTCLP